MHRRIFGDDRGPGAQFHHQFRSATSSGLMVCRASCSNGMARRRPGSILISAWPSAAPGSQSGARPVFRRLPLPIVFDHVASVNQGI